MNYTETLEYLKNTAKSGWQLGLERISELLKRMDNPHKSLNYIHITGTNGKGSVSAMLASILYSSGLKTGFFSSPHLIRINECYQIDGVEISDCEFADIMTYIRSFAEKMNNPPTEFELMTAAAFEFFKRNRCETVVLECLMGGLLDATNVIEKPLLSVITNIDLDHMSYLGETLDGIAVHKAGIIKENRPVLFGDTEMNSIIKSAAQSKNSPLHRVDFERLHGIKQTLGLTEFSFGDCQNLRLHLLGTYQPYNAAIAVTAAEILRAQGLTVTEASIRAGLENVRWKGRFEMLQTSPAVIFDGGHNVEGIRKTVKSIKFYLADIKPDIVIGVMNDKDADGMAREIAPIANAVYAVTPDSPRALDSHKLAEIFKAYGVSAQSFGNVRNGFIKALNGGRPVVILGSLYMYKDIAPCL